MYHAFNLNEWHKPPNRRTNRTWLRVGVPIVTRVMPNEAACSTFDQYQVFRWIPYRPQGELCRLLDPEAETSSNADLPFPFHLHRTVDRSLNIFSAQV